ncbi:MAG: hypothetical protein HC923_01000 [Myxococcales bacterium]|nr:hypothetical protein [Myxococcales bacterium]
MRAAVGAPAVAEAVRQAASLLRAAERPVRVLRGLAWAPSVKETFLRQGARELPVVAYPRLRTLARA